MGKIGEDIIFFIDEGGVKDPRPEGDIDQGVFCFLRIIVEIIHPGAIHGLHAFDEVVDRCRIVTKLPQGVLHPGFTDGEFINIGKGIRYQFQGNMVEGPVGEFDGKMVLLVGLPVDEFDAIQGRLVFAIIVSDVQAGAGTYCDREEGQQPIISGAVSGCIVHGVVVAVGDDDPFVQWETPKIIFFRKWRLTCRRVRPP